jgi:hypothetical protein
LLFAIFVNVPEKRSQIVLEIFVIPQLVEGARTKIVRQFDFSGNNNIIPRGGKKMKISNETVCFSTCNQF